MQKKITVAIILNVVIISCSLGIISYLAVHANIDRSLHNRIALAKIVSDYIESSLQNNLNRLYDISLSGSVDLHDGDWEPESRALETAYRYSFFTDGVFLLDRHGNELLTYPPRDSYFRNLSYIDFVDRVLVGGKPVVSNVFTLEPTREKVIFMMVPLRDRENDIVGVAGGILNPSYPFINQLLSSVRLGESSYVEVVDVNEVVIASNNPSDILGPHNHGGELSAMIKTGRPGIRECRHGHAPADAGEKKYDILSVVPLKIAPWAVVVGEAENELFTPSRELQKKFLLLVIIFIFTAIVFAVGMSRSIVKPLKSLISATNRIAGGDLSHPVGILGSDEILVLSRSFDDMRKKLAQSLEKIQKYNAELEFRVAERTQEIRRSQRNVEQLLQKVISSEEEERKRIARGLHDEILQDLSAFLIKLDICELNPEARTPQKIEEMRSIINKTFDDIHNVIHNMRPLILDDLGLEAAVVWLLDKHLGPKGVDYHVNVADFPKKRFPPKLETSFFRIVQESIINIARHAEAKNVFVTLEADESSLSVCVEDDGKGFDVQKMLGHTTEDGRGLGIVGMMERASLLGGKLGIHSLPGEGTRISVRVPLSPPDGRYV
jgi:signal transduction histidine kinase